MEKLTPMLRQYNAIKRQYQDTLLLFRLGDFYEMFGEDAKIGAKELELVLTSREAGKGKRIPMCGVPYHSVDRYIARLIKRGFKVAICEQVEDPKLAKGIVKREVIRVITPGTVLEDTMLDERANNYLAAISGGEKGYGLAFVDVSTGEFMVTQLEGENRQEKLLEEISRVQPAECLVPEELEDDFKLIDQVKRIVKVTFYDPDPFGTENAYKTLTRHFQTDSLRGFGCEELPLAVEAAGMILKYLSETQLSTLEHIKGLSTYSPSQFMVLDAPTRRNLELVRSIRDGSREGTLLWVLDKTLTPMGARLLKRWVLQPSLNLEEINARLEAVEELFNNILIRQELREKLKGIQDLERLTSRVALKVANARDLVGLKNSLRLMPQIRDILRDCQAPLLICPPDRMPGFSEIVSLIDNAIAEEPPASLREGGLIKPGYNEELDRLRKAKVEGKDWIASLEHKERERTGIKSLKVGYNQVFGYYIEVTKPNLHLVPKDYIRKQTMVNAERFITPELKEYEALVLGAEEKIVDLEYELFCQIRDRVAQESAKILQSAKVIAELDVLSSLAQVALENRYVRPKVTESDRIIIKSGRHPVVEKTQTEELFVPNDAYLDCQSQQLLIITGPNMAGKSTYLRQIALIVLMAQMGSFVPAEEAEIGLVDRIFTRVGAYDDLSMGQSTFMVEMTETANILHNATRRSLIILDEIGRGTSTFDGLSIAWAVAEYIHENPKIGAKTLFATHYHHLNELENILPRAKNYRVAVKEDGEQIIFLRKVVEGGTDRSYGIQVARLGGLPQEVIERAKEVLWSLEQDEALKKVAPRKVKAKMAPVAQLELFGAAEPSPILKELEQLDLSNLTPLQALNKLYEIQQKLKNQK